MSSTEEFCINSTVSHPEIWQNCEYKVQILLIRVFFVSPSWIVSPISSQKWQNPLGVWCQKHFLRFHSADILLNFTLSFHSFSWTGDASEQVSWETSVCSSVLGTNFFQLVLRVTFEEHLKFLMLLKFPRNTLAISLIDPTKIHSECCHEQLMRSTESHFKSSRWKENLFLCKSIICFDEFHLTPDKIMVWYNFHGNRVNLITLTKQIFSPSGFYEKLDGMLQVLRKWYWSAAWGRKFPYFPMILLKRLAFHVIINFSHTDVKTGQTNEISRYIHAWPWQLSSNIPARLLLLSNLQCHRFNYWSASRRFEENENVNVSRVLHWSR